MLNACPMCAQDNLYYFFLNHTPQDVRDARATCTADPNNGNSEFGGNLEAAGPYDAEV